MLRITKQTDYGIVLLATLARCPGRKALTAGQLAAESGIPLAMVSKILKRLAREGILRSQRGARGGYSLSRPPEALDVVEMIAALEGPVGLTECVGPESDCEQQCSCQLHPVWQQINTSVVEVLRGTTLADMVRPVRPLGADVAGSGATRTVEILTGVSASPSEAGRRNR